MCPTNSRMSSVRDGYKGSSPARASTHVHDGCALGTSSTLGARGTSKPHI